MNKSEQLKKENLLKALEKSLGIVSTACVSIGISRTTYYKYYNEDKEFKQSVDSIGDIALDCAFVANEVQK
jgi:ACT domain-containing protein